MELINLLSALTAIPLFIQNIPFILAALALVFIGALGLGLLVVIVTVVDWFTNPPREQ